MSALLRILAGMLIAVAIVLVPAQAAERLSPDIEPIYTDLRGNPIRGYDPVAYFTEGKPMPGKPEFSYQWQGANWLFASAEHRDLFAADPKKYAPQYGGYCAYAASLGWAETVDPEKWKIYEGKLYLNDPSAYERWLQKIPDYVVKADKNWHDLVEAPKTEKK